MTKPMTESVIVLVVARAAAKKVTNKVIRDFRKLPAQLSGDDSGLNSVWEEICVQIQYEQSFWWNA